MMELLINKKLVFALGLAHLQRSNHAGKGGFHSTFKRTSKQSWMWEYMPNEQLQMEYNVKDIVPEGFRVTKRYFSL